MQSIWNYIENEALANWKEHCRRVERYEEGREFIREGLNELGGPGRSSVERLNKLKTFLGYTNQQAADSLVIDAKVVIARLIHHQRLEYGLDIPEDDLQLLTELGHIKERLLCYAEQWNRSLSPTGEERPFGSRLWTGAKVHIEEGKLAYRDNGSRMFITLPNPFAQYVSKLFMGVFDAAREITNYHNKYEYVGRTAEAVGELIKSGEPFVDKELYEVIIGSAYRVIDEWTSNLLKQQSFKGSKFNVEDFFNSYKPSL
ncbi:hypothetical protein CEW91_12025 [Idiomarina piscisalsi]|uniref:Uncharacterized protein n=1 Tax=Idiomarina piscisalsi TaxID=1096243 RepID=A0ABM6LWI3_9GAMM|nr:hypothetical protein [Idiomarina piscisalsi]ASG66819.1 hypothetical protein CEW91_12025 [Idiomarina piscisalsi]